VQRVHIQEVQFTIAAGQSFGTAALSGFTTFGKMVVMWPSWRIADGMTPVIASGCEVDVWATSSSEIRAERGGTQTQAVTVRAFVVEFGADTNVFSGTYAMGAGATTHNAVSIGGTVTLANAFVLSTRRCGAVSGGSNDADPDYRCIRRVFASTSALDFSRNVADGTIDGHWYVVESSTLTVNHVGHTITASSLTSTTTTITSVVTGETFLVVSDQNDENVYNDEGIWAADLQNATTVRLRRSYAASNTVTWAIQVVSDAGISVQRGERTGAGTTDHAVIAAVDLSLAVAKSGYGESGHVVSSPYVDGTLDKRYWTKWLPSTTALNTETSDGADDKIDTWEVVELEAAGGGDVELASTGTVQASGSAALEVAVELASAGTVQASGSAALEVAVELASAGTVQASGSAALDVERELASTATVQTSGSAALDVERELASTATVQTSGSAALEVDVELESTATVQTSGSAALEVDVELESTATVQASGSAALDVERELASTATVETSSTAALSVGGAIFFASTATVQATGSADLDVARELESTATVQADGAAALDVELELASIATVQASGSAELEVVSGIALASVATIQATGSAALFMDVELASVAEVQASGIVFLDVSRFLASTSTIHASSTAELEIDTTLRLASVSTIEASSFADLLVSRELSSNATTAVSGTALLLVGEGATVCLLPSNYQEDSLMDPVSTIVDDFDLTPELGRLVVERRPPPLKTATGGFAPAAATCIKVSPWSAHNVSGRDLNQVPEADRNGEIVQFYSKDASWPLGSNKGFKVADDGFAADIVVYQGRRYRVVTVRNFSAQGRAWCALGSLMEPLTP